MVRRSLVAAAAVGLMVSGISAAHVQARPQPTPTPVEQAAVFDRMLKRTDVPRSLAVSSGIEYTMKNHAGQHQSLCDKNGRTIEGRETDLLYQVELGETNTVADPTAIEQKVWPYASTQQALRQWRYIVQQAKLCTGRSQWKGEAGGNTVQFLSTGQTDFLIDGRPGVWIWIDSRRQAGSSDNEDGGYYVLYLVKDTIQSLEYDYPDAKGLSFRTRQQVDQLAFRLADRWMRSGLR